MSKLQTFVRKPRRCEAIQFDGTDACAEAIASWSKGVAFREGGSTVRVLTAEGVRHAGAGDWIVKDDTGFWVSPDHLFTSLYEVAA